MATLVGGPGDNGGRGQKAKDAHSFLCPSVLQTFSEHPSELPLCRELRLSGVRAAAVRGSHRGWQVGVGVSEGLRSPASREELHFLVVTDGSFALHSGPWEMNCSGRHHGCGLSHPKRLGVQPPDFAEEGKEAQRGEVNCSRTHSEAGACTPLSRSQMHRGCPCRPPAAGLAAAAGPDLLSLERGVLQQGRAG